MNRTVLIDTRPFQCVLKESTGPSGRFIVEGLMQVAGDLNGNGRVYPKNILEREILKSRWTAERTA